MIYAKRTASAIALLCSASLARAQDPNLTFEVASVRTAIHRLGLLGGGPGTQDPERISWRGVQLEFLITRAYGIERDQLSGPAWLSSAAYDVSAKIPPGTTAEPFNQMLQNLLAERFHLEVHRETRIFQAYNLVVGKGALKLKPSEWVPPPHPAPPPGRIYIGDYRVFSKASGGDWTVTGRGAQISDLTKSLRAALHSRVTDATGLTGRYDFTFHYTYDTAGPSDFDVIDAVRDELGLDLKPAKIPLDVVVVDRIERTPTDN